MNRQQQIAGILSAIEGGEISPDQGITVLRSSPAKEHRGRTWLPIWFRFARVSQGRGIRFVIPLFLIGPLSLALFIVFLPFAAIAVAVISIWKPVVIRYFVRSIVVLCSLTTTLFLHGRGMGVWVKDKDNEVGFWLS